MTTINLMPKAADVAKWGVLAHVDAVERQRIMNLPMGQSKTIRGDK